MSSTPPSNKGWKTSLGVPVYSEDLFGHGLSYEEWKDMLGGHWNGQMDKLIRAEFEFFKSEIQLMRSEQPTTKGRTKSNSISSIFLRLKGLPWAKGEPNSREARLREGRLLGEDAKVRCLQNYVNEWDHEASSSATLAQPSFSTESAPSGKSPGQSSVPNPLQSDISPSGRGLAIRSFPTQELSGPGLETAIMQHSQGAVTVVDACLTTLPPASQSHAHHAIHRHSIEPPVLQLEALLVNLREEFPSISDQSPVVETGSNQESHNINHYFPGQTGQEMNFSNPNSYVLEWMIDNDCLAPEQFFIQNGAQPPTPTNHEQSSVSLGVLVEDEEDLNLCNLLPPSGFHSYEAGQTIDEVSAAFDPPPNLLPVDPTIPPPSSPMQEILFDSTSSDSPRSQMMPQLPGYSAEWEYAERSFFYESDTEMCDEQSNYSRDDNTIEENIEEKTMNHSEPAHIDTSAAHDSERIEHRGAIKRKYKSELQEAREENDSLRKENDSLRKENDSLRKEIEPLRKESLKTREEYTSLKKMYELHLSSAHERAVQEERFKAQMMLSERSQSAMSHTTADRAEQSSPKSDRRSFRASKTIVPLMTAGACNGAGTGRSNIPQSPDVNKSGSSDSAGGDGPLKAHATTKRETSPMRNFMSFLRKPHREDRKRHVPSPPPIPESATLPRQDSKATDKNSARRTKDSGYESVKSRASTAESLGDGE